MSLEEDPANPWGGPSERSISTKTVDLLLSLVDSGRGLAALMHPSDPKRRTRIEKLWTHHRNAESMILKELGRRRRIAKQERAEAEALEALHLVDEEEEEDEDELAEGGCDDFSF